MSIVITKKRLIDWAGWHVMRDAESMVSQGRVLEASYEPPWLKGSVLCNNRPLNTSAKVLPDGTIESNCPCYSNRERGVICSHIIAIGLTVVLRATDSFRNQKYQQEQRKASRLAKIDESEYIKRVSADTPNALPAKVHVMLAENWKESIPTGKTGIICEIEYRGKRILANEVSRDVQLSLSKADNALLYVLEDISEGPARGMMEVTTPDLINIIKLHRGSSIRTVNDDEIIVNEASMTSVLMMDLDRENGELIMIVHTELPFMKAGMFPIYIVNGKSGWVYGAGNLWPISNVLPVPYHSIYQEPVIIPRTDVLRFLKHELKTLERHARIESDISEDLFTIEPGTPKLSLRISGSPASLSATLYAIYGELMLTACVHDAKDHFGIPDPNDIMRYTVRNMDAEKAALIRLSRSGFRGETGNRLSSIVGTREVLNFLGNHIPEIRRRGWHVDIKGRVSPYMESLEFTTPVVHITENNSGGWFDVGFDFEDSQGESLSNADIQRAILKGDYYIKKGSRTILIDSGAVESMQDIFSDCASESSDTAGHFRMSNIYSAFVKSALDGIDGIDIESTPAWRERASKLNRAKKLEPIQIEEPLNSTLRNYQKEGVNWMRFLEANSLCGILADEMGLGKTLQTLVWLNTPRINTESQNAPSLVVCPTSLVENWIEEAHKFTPWMKTLNLTGTDRDENWKNISSTNIAVTSYAILRRDIDKYLEHEFAVAVLDEAQHIKNRSTQNAQAAKQVRAGHKLVLTGTPIENSVSDLWSIMDFLMPTYLGSHGDFKQKYLSPITRGDQEGEKAQQKLKKKLHPFLLRRLKRDVAKDLPEKIIKVSFCSLTKDQAMVYNEFLKSSQQKISNMVKTKGFNKSRMEILTILLKLRQTCCHLDLLKLPDLKAEHPSGKMELFFELLNEAIDGGHRILVFSQFVSMLTILRKEMEERQLKYCYIDGSSKDRIKTVHQFNTQRDIPVFLISLKAGGTGLNLTGADMVVHFDPWWNPAVEAQATDRAHRIGQKRTVYSIKLIAKNTVEEKVLAMQKKKQAVINATISNDNDILSKMDWNDIQDLLDLKKE